MQQELKEEDINRFKKMPVMVKTCDLLETTGNE